MGFAWCVWAKRAFVWIKMSKTDETQNSTLLILLMFIPHISYAYTSVRNREYYLLLYCYTYKVHRIWLCESSLREIKAFGVVWFRTVMVTVSCTDAAHTHTFHATNYLLHYAGGAADEKNEKRVFIVIVIGLIIFLFLLGWRRWWLTHYCC